MKSFVVGGSSSIGAVIVRTLIDAGHEVGATFRTSVPPNLDGAAWVRADVRSAADLDALAAPAEARTSCSSCRASRPARRWHATPTT